jgi:isopentenyl diphosphate isomerase/L-lactate dehydrogenase-like FMN-dependent dehydrogenase
MKTLHHVAQPDTSVELFGRRLEMPILAAPVGGVQFNMSTELSEAEYLGSVVRGARNAGSLACTGDGELDEIFEAAERQISAAGGEALPFIKPWAGELVEQRIRKIEDMGAPAFGMDVDAAGLVTLSKMGKEVYPKTPDEIRRICGSTALPFVVKGIMTVEEAEAAVSAGAAGIVVSNHGGRVLDSTQATAEVLPSIADAVGGTCTVLVDGGIRRGTDVFKMLALGADAVLVGRPIAIAAIGGGAEAVELEFRCLKEELLHSMVMTGSGTIAAISRSSLVTS